MDPCEIVINLTSIVKCDSEISSSRGTKETFKAAAERNHNTGVLACVASVSMLALNSPVQILLHDHGGLFRHCGGGPTTADAHLLVEERKHVRDKTLKRVAHWIRCSC